jgi:uncharacterized protein
MDYQSIEALEEDYLYIAASKIPEAGKGLFTAIPIYKDEIISYFLGEELTEFEIKKRSVLGEIHYFMNLLNGGILDCAYTDGFAKYANDCSINGLKNNAKITISDEGEVCLVATKKILANNEIFCGYGKRYWENLGKN